MERITFEVENHSDVQLLVAFANRLGSVVVEEKKDTRTRSNAESRAIIEKGCDITAFGDPSDWQRETRKDRDLPFRKG